MARIVQARLVGTDAEPGQVAATDVAAILIGLQAALRRAARLVLGRARPGDKARHARAAEDATRLRFVGIEPGSVLTKLALPDSVSADSDGLPVSVEDLGWQALDKVLSTIVDESATPDRQLAEALGRLAEALGIGDRNSSLTLTSDFDSAAAPVPTRTATIDAAARGRLQPAIAVQFDIKQELGGAETLSGILFEADFESHTAQLRLSDGTTVSVSYGDDLSEQIYEALRDQVRVVGQVSSDRRTSRPISVTLRAIERGSQLSIKASDFWESKTFAQLQAEQGTAAAVEPHTLVIPDLTDDERAAFLAGLAE